MGPGPMNQWDSGEVVTSATSVTNYHSRWLLESMAGMVCVGRLVLAMGIGKVKGVFLSGQMREHS